MFETECSFCGNKGHTTSNCPHSILQTECASCGATGHASSDCPHGFFSTECDRCGSKEHATANCPQGFFASRPNKPRRYEHDDSPWTTFFAKLTAGLLVIGCLIWLAVFVVVPLAVMNSATVLAVLAFLKKPQRSIFASLSLLGAGYLLVDVSAGLLSAMFTNAMQSPAVVNGIVVLNSAAAGVSTWYLVQPLWNRGRTLKETDANAGLARMAGAGSLVVLSLIAIPISYNFIANDVTES